MDYDLDTVKGVGMGLVSCEESQRQKLERSKKHYLSRIQDIDRALALLKKYPEIEELQDLLRRI